jgi:diphosphomevalonate decarboxylase
LDRVRAAAGLSLRAEVRSRNGFPTASGLASSASAFAALAAAASTAAGLSPTPPELARLARLGSGSAARSIYGGFVEMAADGEVAPLASAADWDLRIVAALTTLDRKSVSSTEGMERTARTSPYYRAWMETHEADLAGARAAVLARDLRALGEIAEANALKMHAAALTARPAILYWNAATIDVLHAVRHLRDEGLPGYFTIDAGPHVKVLCAARDASRIEERLRAIPGVVRTLLLSPGEGVEHLPAS